MISDKRNLIELLAAMWIHVEKRRRIQLFWLVILMVVTSLAEVISLGALLPFLAVITSPEKLLTNPKATILIEWLEIQSSSDLMMSLTILFCIAVFTAGSLRLILLWASTKFSYALGADMSMEVYRKTLYQPYITHVSRNSSELISGIATKTSNVILHIINPLVIATASSIILIAILIVLIMVDPAVALVTFIGFSSIYLIIILLTRVRLAKNSNRISADTTRVVQSLQEGLGGIRDVLLGGVQKIYCDNYSKADLTLRKAQASNFFISNSPRFVIESSGMILIALIALNLTDRGTSEAIMVLGLFALGAQRLLPVLQQLYHSWTAIKGNQDTLRDIIHYLEQTIQIQSSTTVTYQRKHSFAKHIELVEVSFRYAESLPWVLNKINLSIKKGDRVGFIGTTGSGKSTLLDIMMALLVPTVGSLKVDNVVISEKNAFQWQSNIGHVPQSIFLIDAPIAENIAFGEKTDSIDFERVQQAAKKAQIASTIESWPDGYSTMVGERGVRLSGGQRQRIGIARALYKHKDIIVFDEATSALDEKTEESLMEAIDSLDSNLTILVIAHRLSTLRGCDYIIELEGGEIRAVDSFQDRIRALNNSK